MRTTLPVTVIRSPATPELQHENIAALSVMTRPARARSAKGTRAAPHGMQEHAMDDIVRGYDGPESSDGMTIVTMGMTIVGKWSSTSV